MTRSSPHSAEHHAAMGSLTVEQVRVITDVVSHFCGTRAHHRTGVVDGDLTHFAAGRSAQDFLLPTAWEPHARGTVHYTELPVNHPGMVAPNSLAAVAEAMEDCR